VESDQYPLREQTIQHRENVESLGKLENSANKKYTSMRLFIISILSLEKSPEFVKTRVDLP